jgi:acetyl esterase/lipase
MTNARTLIASLLVLCMTSAIGDRAAAQTVRIDAGIKFGSSGQLLDVCVPPGATKRVAMLFVHGGGFRSGSRADMLPFCRLYAEGGIVAATVDYRLSPAHVFPAALTDVREALTWFKAQSQHYGFDARKVVIVGYSAGANLALMTALTNEQQVASAIAVAGPTDLKAMIEGPTFEQATRDIRAYLGPVPPEVGSPMTYVSRGDPAVFLFHGQNDTFVPVSHSLLLAERLQQNNVPVLLRVFPGAGHEIMLPGTNFKQLLDEMTRYVIAIDGI